MIKDTVQAALAQGRSVLLEHEVYQALAQVGMPTPWFRFIPMEAALAGEVGDLTGAPLDNGAVLKVVSPEILHKSDVGGVRRLERVDAATVGDAVEAMAMSVPADQWATARGVLLCQAVSYQATLGRELLLGLVGSPDFGEVITVGLGGTAVEALAAATRPGQSTVLFRQGCTTPERLSQKLERSLFFRWASGGIRGVAGALTPKELRAQIRRWIDALSLLCRQVEEAGASVAELELNPLCITDDGQLLPLDGLLRLGEPVVADAPFPQENLRRALAPKSVAVMGVSRKVNVGRIILRCILEGQYPAEQVTVLRADMETIDGVRCLPSLDDLEQPVDLLVMAVAAPAVPGELAQVMATGKARGVLLIPGGMGETEQGKGIEAEVTALLEQYAGTDRPCLIGNNSLGFITKRAGFDSLFIPRDKLPRVESWVEGGAAAGKVALLSQSGAFMITRASKLDWLSPAYQLSIGNQVDARVSHFMEALLEDEALTTLALYIEGFKPGDGARLLELTRRAVEEGRDVVAYRAGRSPLGRSAAMGHTASIAGEYRLFAELMEDAGALVAHTFDDFTDLVTLSATLRHKELRGRRVALMSNAGFESVGMADNHEGLEPAVLTPATVARMTRDLDGAGIAHLINVHNPLDVTPMAGDALLDQLMAALLEDPGVDLGLFGMVPLTPMVQTLPHGESDRDVFDAEEGFARRVIRLGQRCPKPLVVVLDGGRLYDPMAAMMQAGGLPVFRSGDRAIKALARYAGSRLI